MADAQSAYRVRPLGHRLLIVPDTLPETTDSGILIPDAYRDTPPMSGIVAQVGNGYLRDRTVRKKAIARCLSLLADAQLEAATADEAIAIAKDEMGRYLREIDALESVAAIGQRVIFPMEAGHEIVIGESEQALVLVSEDSVLAVYDAEEVAA